MWTIFSRRYIEHRRNWVRGAKRRGRQIRRTYAETSSLCMHIVNVALSVRRTGLSAAFYTDARRLIKPGRPADVFTACLLPTDRSRGPSPSVGRYDATNIEPRLYDSRRRSYNWLARHLIDVVAMFPARFAGCPPVRRSQYTLSCLARRPSSAVIFYYNRQTCFCDARTTGVIITDYFGGRVEHSVRCACVCLFRRNK